MRSIHSARYKQLLKRLRSARLEAALTQAQVARTFGRPQSFISKCESGERRLDVLELDRFAELYDRPLSFFVAEGEDESLHGAGLVSEGPTPSARGRSRGAGRRRRPRATALPAKSERRGR